LYGEACCEKLYFSYRFDNIFEVDFIIPGHELPRQVSPNEALAWWNRK
jgi:hypothetical protein